MRRIYLDANASAPLRPEARAAMERAGGLVGNPSAVHAFGRRARAAVDEAREAVAALVGAAPGEILFTSGGTEANLWAVSALAGDGRAAVSEVEHASVLAGASVVPDRTIPLRVDRAGRLDPNDLDRAFRLRPALVSLQWANNEIGTIQPVAEAAARCRRAGVAFHVDAVQAVGRLAVDLAALGADAATISAHKFGGPAGAGALWVRADVRPRLRPLLSGEQEEGLRGGTENLVGISGMGAAAAAAAAGWRDEAERERRLRDRLLERLRAEIPGLVVRGRPEDLPNTLNVGISGIDGESAVLLLDSRGVACSTGAACHSGNARPSHVLRAIGCSRDEARSSLRLSLWPGNTEEEIDAAAVAIAEVAAHLRAVAPENTPPASPSDVL